MSARHIPTLGLAIAASILVTGVSEASAVPVYGDAARLDGAIRRYEAAASLPPVGAGALLRSGDSGPRVERLTARLVATGDLAESQATDRYTDAVARAVRSFQTRRSLEVDGKVGEETQGAIDGGTERALTSLRATRDRMKKFAPKGDRYILVNVPDHKLLFVDDGAAAEQMTVVVGEPDWATPEMSDAMTVIVLNPQWNVPVELVAQEIAPQAAKDPKYLERKNLIVKRGGFDSDDVVDPKEIDWANVTEENFAHFIVQPPGPSNPLGNMKFLFPNEDDIYLHAAANDAVFGRKDRAITHGCVRVEAPAELAARILGSGARARIDEILASGETKTLAVEPSLPVHLVYWTAWVDDEGRVHTRDDLYERDRGALAGR